MAINDLNIGLTLSGGGVRASSFHLGVLKRLAQENLLERVHAISTVSGGSLLMGLIYRANGNKWPNSIEFSNCYDYVQACLTTRNLQINVLLRTLFWRIKQIGKGRAAIVGAGIKQCWDIKANLNDIDIFPKWIINGTAIESGKSWRFIPQSRMGDYVLNYVSCPNLQLCDVLGASAGVPFLLGPLTIKTSKYKWYRYDVVGNKIECAPKFKRIHIWDGGAYDNLGIEPLAKFKSGGNGLQYRDEINFLMVSDAALEIDTSKRIWYNPMRLIDITMDQVRALRARALWDHFQHSPFSGVYFKIGQTINTIKKNFDANYNLSNKGLSDKEIEGCKYFPTTLRKLTQSEFNNLVKHGWEVANAALVCQCPSIFQDQKS